MELKKIIESHEVWYESRIASQVNPSSVVNSQHRPAIGMRKQYMHSTNGNLTIAIRRALQ